MFVISSRQWKKVPSELIGVWGGNFVAVMSRAPLATGLSASGKVAQTATCRISGDYSGVTGNFYQARVSLGAHRERAWLSQGASSLCPLVPGKLLDT